MREGPRRVDANPGVGDIERAVRADRHVVRELGAPPAEIHGVMKPLLPLLDGLGRLEPLDRQHPGGGGGRGLLRLATAGNGEGGEPEREDTPRLQAHRDLLYGSGAACKAAGKAPTYPGNPDPGRPVGPAVLKEGPWI